MRDGFVRGVAATLTALAFWGAIAGTDSGSRQNSTVISSGDFKQAFRVMTDASYNNIGSISVMGMQSLFGGLNLNHSSNALAWLTGVLATRPFCTSEKASFLNSKLA